MADPMRAVLSPFGLDTERYDRSKREMITEPQKNFTTDGEPLEPHRDKKTGKLKAGFVGSRAANFLPFGIADLILNATGTNEFPAESMLSTLLGGTLGIHMR